MLFIVFSGVGVAALGGSMLCDELLGYYRNRKLLKQAHQSTERLKSLNAEYDSLLQRLETDPNLFRRISPAVLGNEPDDPNTVYPKARAEQLAAARKAVTDPNTQSADAAMPDWLTRCSEPRKRILLFASGAALVLIAFACFGPTKQLNKQKDRAA